MPKYVIERDLPGAGKLSAEDLRAISQKSNKVISELGPELRWLTSYVTEDKLYCVYVAPDQDVIEEHRALRRVPCRPDHQGLRGDRSVYRRLRGFLI